MIVYPVIHFENLSLAMTNAEIAFEAGADGLFLIDMTASNESRALLSGKTIKEAFPDKKIGINLLSMTIEDSLEETIKYGLDMFWEDFPGIFSNSINPIHLDFPDILDESPEIEFFASVAFKGQRKEKDPGVAAMIATRLGYVPTTSGPGTGQEINMQQLVTMRYAMDDTFGTDQPLALASGVTPGNVLKYKGYATHILVSTGVSRSFHMFDEDKLNLLIERAKMDDTKKIDFLKTYV